MRNSRYFNIYTFLANFILLVIICLFAAGCEKTHINPEFAADSGKLSDEKAININSATIAELETLPFIGEKTARKIVEHRQKYGNFRKPEHLILVQGISDKKFRQMKKFIKTE